MKLWYKLNLPLERLTKYGLHLATHPQNKPGINYTIITQPDLVLANDLLAVFASLNVHPWFVVFNTHPHLPKQKVSKEFIHKDLTGLGGTNWQAINGGLSFEVNSTTKSVFRWFDTADYPFDWLNGSRLFHCPSCALSYRRACRVSATRCC